MNSNTSSSGARLIAECRWVIRSDESQVSALFNKLKAKFEKQIEVYQFHKVRGFGRSSSSDCVGSARAPMIRDIEHIIDQVKQRFPTAVVWQLQVKHPGFDDDGIWFFTLPNAEIERYRWKDIQLESSDGTCPFMVEHDDMKSSSEAETARSIGEAVEKVCSYLTSLQTQTP